jgi:DNA polymerase-3 subunit epsilon
MVATAETVLPGPGPLPAASAEETECVLRWLERPGCRLVRLDGTWSSPAHGAAGLRAWLDLAYAGRAAVAGPEARRGLRPGHRPAR